MIFLEYKISHPNENVVNNDYIVMISTKIKTAYIKLHLQSRNQTAFRATNIGKTGQVYYGHKRGHYPVGEYC